MTSVRVYPPGSRYSPSADSWEDYLLLNSHLDGDHILWDGPTGSHGYGSTGSELVHHIAARLWIGPNPGGLHVLHDPEYNNKLCISPVHLRYGTNKENMEDKAAAGLQPSGELHAFAKVTDTQVMEIRAYVAEGTRTYVQLKVQYNFGLCALHDLVYGKTWDHLPLVEPVGGPRRKRRGV